MRRTSLALIQINNPEFQKIHSYARWNKEAELMALLDRGCPINLPDLNKNTPLIVAAQNGHHGLVELLVVRGPFPPHVPCCERQRTPSS